jgi:hypothetical protein
MGQDWKTCENSREKYGLYMASREWGLLREGVRKRGNGRCERCKIAPIDHVHHLTYIRKYNEKLEDLEGLCYQCHEYLHGKSHFDPLSVSRDDPAEVPPEQENPREVWAFLVGLIDPFDGRRPLFLFETIPYMKELVLYQMQYLYCPAPIEFLLSDKRDFIGKYFIISIGKEIFITRRANGNDFVPLAGPNVKPFIWNRVSNGPWDIPAWVPDYQGCSLADYIYRPKK